MKSKPPTAPGERRDPCSPLMLVANALREAHIQRKNAVIEVYDQQHVHRVELVCGAIGRITGLSVSDPQSAAAVFALQRPQVRTLRTDPEAVRPVLDPDPVIVRGIVRNRHRMNPAGVMHRIPVAALEPEPAVLHHLLDSSLYPEEARFVEAALRPTPVGFLLTKRGLDPDHAAALLLGINLVGGWRNWKPGVLPRMSQAAGIVAAARTGNAAAVLGVGPDATPEEIDRAFRRLAFALHPDRHLHAGAALQQEAAAAFAAVHDAYQQLKRTSRRSRPVRAPWHALWQRAEAAWRAGDTRRARKEALNALALRPPHHVRMRLNRLLLAA